ADALAGLPAPIVPVLVGGVREEGLAEGTGAERGAGPRGRGGTRGQVTGVRGEGRRDAGEGFESRATAGGWSGRKDRQAEAGTGRAVVVPKADGLVAIQLVHIGFP